MTAGAIGSSPTRLRTPLDALAWALERITDRGDYWHRAAELLEVGHQAQATPDACRPDTAVDRPLGQIATLERQRDGWREEATFLRRRLVVAESDIDAMRKHQANDVWYYQGDGRDHVESMATDMVVVIHAGDLRALLAASAKGEAVHA